MFHSSHSRNGPPYHSSGHHGHSHSHHSHGHSHGHSFHRGRNTHLHGGTLIHFPHSSSHQSLGSKEESSRSSVEQSLSPNHKEKAEQKSGSYKPTDAYEREPSWDDLSKLHNRHDTFSPHMRGERSAKYSRFAEGISDEERKETRSPIDESKIEEREKAEQNSDERGQRVSHYEERTHSAIHGGRSEQRHVHDLHLASHSGNPSYISSVSEKALASAKASYLNKDAGERGYILHTREDKHHSHYPFSSPREKDNYLKSSIISPNSHTVETGFDKKGEYHLVKHEQHKEPTSFRESNSNSLHDERMKRAEATREWVNKQPALHVSSSLEHYVKQEKRCKDSEPSPLNRKSESPKTAAGKVGRHDKAGGSLEKGGSKKDQHYESPLNSSLPRYSSAGGHGMKSDVDRPEPNMQKRGKNPFNVDFLSVSSDTDGQAKREADRHYHITNSQENNLDRVSVIKSSLAVPALNRDTHSKKGADGARSQYHSSEVYDRGSLTRPSSLLDSPLPPKPVHPVSGKPRSFIKPDDLSPRNSDSDSSSEDESGDQIEEEGRGTGKHLRAKDWEIEQDGTENDGMF